ncbi:MAG: radical SAM protein [Deltaproteobacteria bacterium]|nr:radical SAM protein [Deltaproteobacteria bacterium]
MTIPLKHTIIYGPVNSRRLGSSLGINILGRSKKQCSFNCVYCQYGWTTDIPSEDAWDQAPGPDAVLTALEDALRRLPKPPQYITFSGNGEPTLHPAFPEIVDRVLDTRNRLSPDSKVAVLSNSSTITRLKVQRALSRLDVRIMKLDAGTQETFHRFNQNVIGLSLEEVVAGLQSMGDVTIQALFAKGPAGNFSEPEVQAWINRLKSIAPTSVQVYTLARGYPSDAISPLSREELESIGEVLKQEGIPGKVY